MKKNIYKLLIFLTIVYLVSACLGKDKEIEYSDNPYFVSLKFGANDSIPGLVKAVFTLEYDADLNDSIIVNLDSLPFQTRIDSVFPTFTFKSTSYAYLIATDSLGTGLDTLFLTGKDTIDFTKVHSITNFSANEKVSRIYPIKINVHQIEPELYVWRKLVNNIYNHSSNTQQAVFFQNRFLLFAGSGLKNYLYTSADAIHWTDAAVTGLPETDNVRGIRVFQDKLYIVHENGLIYTSDDGENWSSTDPAVPGYVCHNLLFVLENNLWGLFKQEANQQYYFANSEDGANWTIHDAVPANFPIVDYAGLSFSSRTGKPKAIVMGGRSTTGNLLSKVWSVEKNIFNAYKWVDFSVDKFDTEPFSGASVIPYDNKLLMFGSMDANDNIIGGGYMESIDEGLSWRATDSVFNIIQDTVQQIVYQPRAYQSVILDEANHLIYLIGGRNKDQQGVRIFSDVWVGKLNKMFFLE
jgi:hypothetical protein